jgi:hypothetical protein
MRNGEGVEAYSIENSTRKEVFLEKSNNIFGKVTLTTHLLFYAFY